MREPVVFATSIESLFVRGLRLSYGAREELRRMGLDVDRPLLPAYPLATWEAALRVATRDVFFGRAPEEARFELGRQMLRRYESTMVGRAIATSARLIGPRRTLERMAQNTRTANNYVKATAEPLADGGMLMTNAAAPELERVMRARGHTLSSPFLRGTVTAILEMLEVPQFEVTEVPGDDPLRVSCRVHW
jgi:uncharacterized protein (TIGR02265 family)